MVGTPRSTGCDNCRKRKKKCGEERPECLACVAAGWTCPGFTKRWKFIDENPQLSSHYQKKRYLFEEIDPVSISGLKRSQHEYQLDLASYERLFAAPCGKFNVGISRSLTSERDSSGSMLTYILEDPKSQALFPISSHGNFFGFIPSRLGHNLALDTAISCLCGVYVDTLTNNLTTPETAIRRYVKSLNSLRTCLEDTRRRFESETICASIILQLCELLMNADYGRWNHLSRGTKYLIQNCGPAKYVDPFERAMLESQRAWFIVQDMDAGQNCFLSQSVWRQLLQSPATSPVPTGPPSLSLRAKLCDLLVDGPDLLSEATNLTIPDGTYLLDPSGLQTRHDRVLSRASAMKRGIETWYAEEFEPLLLASNSLTNDQLSDSPPLDTPNKSYPEILFAVLDCISNSVLVRLEDLLFTLTLDSPQHYAKLDLTVCPTLTARRQETVRSSLDFVKRNSKVAAKPLEFGLQQIWSIGGVFDQYHPFTVS